MRGSAADPIEGGSLKVEWMIWKVIDSECENKPFGFVFFLGWELPRGLLQDQAKILLRGRKAQGLYGAPGKAFSSVGTYLLTKRKYLQSSTDVCI